MKYHIERSTEINADLTTVKGLVADFTKWESWSPWTVVEPDTKTTIEGTAGEAGHTMTWEGAINGSGTNTLTNNESNTLTYDLVFMKPFKSQATTTFLFEETGSGTKVTWTMDSTLPFFLFFLVNMMKVLIGMDYDRGLRMLKEVAEKGSVNAETTNNGVVDIPEISYVGIKRTVPFGEMPTQMKKDYEKIIHDVVTTRGKKAQHWLSLYPKFHLSSMKMTYIAAISDENLKDDDLGADYVKGTVKAGKALEIKHRGSYDFIANAWSMGMMYFRIKKLKKNGIPFEQYWNSPMEVAPEELQTSVYFPVK